MYEQPTTLIPQLKKSIAIFTALSILLQSMAPMASYALTGGPSAPEFSAFEPVSSANMVNEFTGDFTYNIPVLNVPGPHGSGYSMSLSYHSGTSPEEEASWVGYGWALNPGAVNRQKRGFADDWSGQEIEYYNKTPKNASMGYAWYPSIGLDAFGVSIESFSLDYSERYNNYKGLGFAHGYGMEFLNTVSFNENYDDTEATLTNSMAINPGGLLSNIVSAVSGKLLNTYFDDAGISSNRWFSTGFFERELALNMMGNVSGAFFSSLNSYYGFHSKEVMSKPTYFPSQNGKSIQTSTSLSIGIPIAPGVASIDLGYGFSTSVNVLENEKTETKNVYGYLHTADADSKGLTDYYNERNSEVYYGSRFLPAPFSNQDQFSLTAENISGGFKFHNKRVPTYKPGNVESTTEIKSAGEYVSLSLSSLPTWITSSGDGESTMKISGWDNSAYSEYSHASKGDEAYFAAFDGDLSSNIVYKTDKDSHLPSEDVMKADLTGSNDSYEFELSSAYASKVMLSEDNNRVQRSSYINYHTNKQIADGFGYTHKDAFTDFINRSDAAVEDQIGEFTTYNEGGMRYNYGLPVYSKDEAGFKYGLIESDEADLHYRFLVYKDISDDKNIPTKVGEKSEAPYANSWLLTDITSADYIDRSMNGISDDDFGAWTKFNYTQKHGTINKSTETNWFKWRSPYEGLLYDPGSLSTHLDDGGTVRLGEKEVYYLKSIETKTHIAQFIVSERLDALSAPGNNEAAKGSYSKNDLKESYKLDKIELYTKDENGEADELLQTIHFEYDYSLMRGRPNSNGDENATGDNLEEADGVLTLKKVWIDYEGTYNVKVSPYEFSYKYKKETDYASAIQNLYPDIVSYGNDLVENPDYSIYNIDPWGNYQEDGYKRYTHYRNWVNQNPDATFDPAAWQLKQIKLPSGGEILIQYEQDDYKYVQDYPAFIMVGLESTDGSGYIDNGYDASTSLNELLYTLNLDDIGEDINPKELGDYLNYYFNHLESYKASGKKNNGGYNSGSKYIYAKFLFGLTGDAPALDKCNSDYIKGYVQYLGYDQTSTDKLKISLLEPKSGGKYSFHGMWGLCYDFYQTNRNGLIDNRGVVDLKSENGCWQSTNPDYSNLSLKELKSLPWQGSGYLTNEVGANLLADLGGLPYEVSGTFSDENIGKKINADDSYIRIPVYWGKKGGGIRVKRLLSYDDGIASSNPVLYGNEYVYQLQDGSSSGVATNEPASIKEENALTQYLDLQNDDLISSRDGYAQEVRQEGGPIGESIYSGAMVGYSRVVSKNINSGKTNPGFVVKKFNTTYDYPTKVDVSSITAKEYNPAFDYTLEQIFMENVAYQSSEVVVELLLKPLVDIYEFFKNIGEDLLAFIETLFTNPEDIIDAITEFVNNSPAEVLKDLKGLGGDIETAINDMGNFFTNFINWLKYIIEGNSEKAQKTWDSMTAGIDEFFDSFEDMFEDIANIIDKMNPDHTRNHENYLWATQGYSVILNNMNGMPKNVANYEGDYENINDLSSCTKVSEISYNYYEPGETVKIFNGIGSAFTDDVMGVSMDVAMEARVIKSELNLTQESKDVWEKLDELLGDKIDLSATSKLTNKEAVYTHVTTKVINYSPVLKSTKTYQDGITNKTENYAFDQNTGKPVVVKTYDEFHKLDLAESEDHNGTYTSYTIPSSHEYQGMNQKAFNEGFHVKDKNDYDVEVSLHTSGTGKYFLNLSVLNSSADITDISDHLHKGDLLAISGSRISRNGSSNLLSEALYFHITSIDDELVSLNAVNEDGDEIVISDAELEVIKSYRSNQLSAVAGNVTSYGSDCFESGSNPFENCVLNASAITYSNNWEMTDETKEMYDVTETNEYLTSENGKWGPVSSWVYNTNAVGGSKDDEGERIYKSAGAADEFHTFDWSATTQHENWDKISTVTEFAPHGEALEEKDILGIYSAVQLGYHHTLPVITAVNAQNTAIYFESFENNYSTSDEYLEFENKVQCYGGERENEAHAGKYSLKLNVTEKLASATSAVKASSSSVYGNKLRSSGIKSSSSISSGSDYYANYELKNTTLTTSLLTNGMLISFWLKAESDLDFDISIEDDFPSVDCKKVKRIGEWTLYEAKITDWGALTKGDKIVPAIMISLSDANAEIYLDDVRMQPLYSETNCYVYDASSSKLLASFDSQHLGLYYQYNAEGKLIRKIAETEKGKLTIKETHYNMPTEERPTATASSSAGSSFSDITDLSSSFEGVTIDLSNLSIIDDETLKDELDELSNIDWIELLTSSDNTLKHTNTDVLSEIEIYAKQTDTDAKEEYNTMLSEMLGEYIFYSVYFLKDESMAKTLLGNSDYTDEEIIEALTMSFNQSFYDYYITQNSEAVSFDAFELLVSVYKNKQSSSLLHTLNYLND